MMSTLQLTPAIAARMYRGKRYHLSGLPANRIPQLRGLVERLRAVGSKLCLAMAEAIERWIP